MYCQDWNEDQVNSLMMTCVLSQPAISMGTDWLSAQTSPDFRQLCSSSDTSILCIPTVRTHWLGQRSFSHAVPAVWNTLPYKLRSSNTNSSFKSSLNTYLFQQSYWLCVFGRGKEGKRVREREGKEWGGRERELVIYCKVCEFFFSHFFCFM